MSRRKPPPPESLEAGTVRRWRDQIVGQPALQAKLAAAGLPAVAITSLCELVLLQQAEIAALRERVARLDEALAPFKLIQ